MPRRTYRKDVSVPRDPGDPMVRVSLSIPEDELAWLRAEFGKVSTGVQRLLRTARLAHDGRRRVPLAELPHAYHEVFVWLPKADLEWAKKHGGTSAVVRTLIGLAQKPVV